MLDIPDYINVLFGLITFATIFTFFSATKNSTQSLIILFVWIGIQGVLSYQGFYKDTFSWPPRFILLVLPTLIFIGILFITKTGKNFLNSLNIKTLTLLHLVRIPVEIVLFLLASNKAIPAIMTFEGLNFDIFSGISAPLIYYFVFVKKSLSKRYFLLWNFICLALLINIVSIAILSVPTSFQKFGLDQPNIAVMHFPFSWLPCCVVPLVLLSHLATIRKLVLKNE